MYTLDLICSNGHKFEGWFSNRNSFEKQRDLGLISCTMCGDCAVKQTLSAIRIKKHAEEKPVPVSAPKPEISKSITNEIAKFVEKNFEDVGTKFADEALKIHLGDAEKRNIRGTATADEEKSLAEEGISFVKLPQIQ